MRFPRTAVVLASTAVLAALAVPAVALAKAAPAVRPSALVIDVDVAAEVSAKLGRPSASPLCGLDRRPVVVIADSDLRALFCVDLDTAAEIEADAAVR